MCWTCAQFDSSTCLWNSYVITVIVSDWIMYSFALWGMNFPSFWNLIFHQINISFLLTSFVCLVAKYLHDNIMNNNAKNKKLITEWYHFVDAKYNIDLNTNSGRPLLFLVDLYWFLKPLNWSKKKFVPSLSSMGSFMWFDLKSCATYETLVLTLPLKILY